MENIFLTNKESDKELYKKIISQTSEAILNTFDSDKAYSGPTPEELKSIIHQTSILPEKGLGWEKALELTKEKILPNLLKPSSTDYMAHLHGSSLLETIAAELIISTFNQSMDSWDQSPVATEIEVEVIKYLCKLYGYNDNSDGVFTSGGSQSNQTAIILARDSFCNKELNYDIKKYGVNEKCLKLRMYTSEISHFSMEKSAHILGLGYQSVVKVPVDKNKRMDISLLEKLIAEDIEKGNIPFLIVGTVGTTDFGSIDDIKKLSEIAKRNKMWLHADAAYGSGVILSDKYANLDSNLNLCDSITVDFHKMFVMPISCSAVLIKNRDDFNALTIHADYLNREEDEEDGYTNLVDKSLQTTRRFDALKVWISFQMRGKDGWAKIINTSIENAAYLYSILQKDSDFETAVKPEISSVVFRFVYKESNSENPEKSDFINKKVRRTLIHSYGTVIGQTVSDGKVFLKFTLLNPLITHEKLDKLVSLIKQLSYDQADN
ncbi:MAG: aspartate aminotransferase family protein [Treponema sp.]|nr:aspartate aminotransferase family protein [Treponema sp.]